MVKCEICKREFRIVTNTHIASHNMTVEEYISRFPDSPRFSDSVLKERSKAMIGKNVGRERSDAKERMMNNNPMKDPRVAKKMGQTRSDRIVNGQIDALSNLGHLPTDHEKYALSVFENLNIPLEYCGDGRLFINGQCPDFINKERMIVLELDLDIYRHEEEKAHRKAAYREAGYLPIWLTSTDESHIAEWVLPWFSGGPKWKRVDSVKVVRQDTKVYDFETGPNHTYFANNIVVHNCFADAFRASLYTAFFDNSKSMGLRHCNPAYYKKELDGLMGLRGKDPHSISNDVKKAIAIEIPMRMGIRFEDFTPSERKTGISLQMLQYLASVNYPVMLNTKSDLVGAEPYVQALAGNKAGSAVHITMISSSESILKRIEPGAPSFARRIQAAKNLIDAGVRVVARIEPFLVFITDEREQVEDYMDQCWNAGIRHITFDTYSYSANNPGIRASFIREGFDFERMFTLGCDSQALGSLLLDKFMGLFRAYGFSCSTFDLGCAPTNDQTICCEVGDLFKGGFNYGSIVVAARFIMERGIPTRWSDFEEYVNKHGGFLSDRLRTEVHRLWNVQGNNAYAVNWSAGIEPYGRDENGIIWQYDEEYDHREEILNGIIS